jgi:hypothetical protein
MKRILLTTAAITAMALGLMAAAGDSFQLTWSGPRGGVMGGVVQGAPYSGEEVTTQDHVLGDGTHIHNESHTKVYRDAEGRTRRESEDMINIYDPVAGVAYVLNPKTMTARQMKVSVVTVTSNGVTTKGVATSSGAVSVNSLHTGGGVGVGVGVGVDGPNFIYETRRVETVGSGDETVASDAAVRTGKMALDKLAAEQAMDQVKADTQARMEIIKMADGTPDGGAFSFGAGTYSFKTETRAAAKKEPLGTQVLEGVLAEGSRTTSTLDTGAIGNDRPIHVVAERWMSGDLHTVIMTKHSDPRSGEEVFRLINVNRSNPDPTLFQLPSGYTLAEEKRIVTK